MKREKEVVSIELQAKNSENMKKKKKPEPGYLGGIGNLTTITTKTKSQINLTYLMLLKF